MRTRCVLGALALLTGTIVIISRDAQVAASPPQPVRPVAVTRVTTAVDDLGLLRRVQARASRAAWRQSMLTRGHRNRVRRAVTPEPGPSSLEKLSASWARQPFAILVANCESGGGPTNHDDQRYDGDPTVGNAYVRGKWQFAWDTWSSVGGAGDPAQAPVPEQDLRAYLLWKRDGWGPWQCAGLVSP